MSKPKIHPARVPLSVAGGIRAQAGRGVRARHGWGQRWIALLETRMAGPRLGRGRNYAASGQVASLSLEPGRVTAVVQGASPQPYHVTLNFRTLNAEGRRLVLAALNTHPLLLARLLAGEPPPEVEAVFSTTGCPLFPEDPTDLRADCTCPDWANPCKHTAAVGFLLAEAVDRDPLLLLALRGVTRDTLVGQPPPWEHAHPEGAVDAALPLPESGDALPADPVAFWGQPTHPDDPLSAHPDLGPAPAEGEIAPLVRRLGAPPFWRGEERFLEAMRIVYGRAVTRGWTVWSGERLDLRRVGEDPAATPATRFRLRSRRQNMDLTIR